MKAGTERLAGTGWSYIRFSGREQEKGDSVRRQKCLRDQWLAENPGVRLDERKLEDLGVPAYRGAHRHDDRHALAQFVKWIDDKVVLPGHFLIVESLDRLTREEIGEGTELFLSIINRGVRVVVLMPRPHVFAKPVQLTDLIVAIVELSRANSESAVKSQRVSEKWSERKKAARAKATGKPGEIVTARCPKWLRVAGGRFEFRAGALKLIRRIFTMSRAGHGARAIAATLNREKVPGWGKGKWEEAYVRKILSGREVLGEYQPCRVVMAARKGLADGKPPRVKTRIPDGDPIPDYYPAAVDEGTWYAVAAARQARDNRGGRPPVQDTHVNVFAGLLHDATTGSTLRTMNRVGDNHNLYRVLISSAYRRHGEPCLSFPFEAFEWGVLSRLKEIRAADILPDTPPGNRLDELAVRKKRYEARLTAAKAAMQDGDENVESVMESMRKLEAKVKAAADELADERRRVESPLSETWGECRGLIEALETATDKREARVRLRGALRRVVSGIYTVFVPLGAWRAAAVQVWFDGGQHRDYLILYRPTRPTHGKMVPAVRRVRSFADVGVGEELDLRKKDHAAVLGAVLASIDPKELAAAVK